MKTAGVWTAALLLWTAGTAHPAEAPTPSPRPHRIVSLLPSFTDTLAVLGALDSLAAVSDAEDPRLLPRLPRVGSLEPSWEALAALHPDLILADDSHRRHAALFTRLHLPVAFLPATDAATLDDVFALVLKVGALAGREEAARRWVDRARERARTLDTRRLPPPGPAVYFEVWPHPLQACGPRSWQGQLLERAGARNVVTDAESAMPLVSAEAVVRANPDVILHMGPASDDDIRRRPGWKNTAAVKTMRIVGLDEDLFSRAGPRVLDAWEALLHALSDRRP